MVVQIRELGHLFHGAEGGGKVPQEHLPPQPGRGNAGHVLCGGQAGDVIRVAIQCRLWLDHTCSALVPSLKIDSCWSLLGHIFLQPPLLVHCEIPLSCIAGYSNHQLFILV